MAQVIAGSIPCHASNYTKGRAGAIQYIVLHYTANDGDTARGNCQYFSGPNRLASAHYFVDEHGVWLSVPEQDTAWHCGANRYKHPTCRNDNAIGIEMCSRKDTRGNYYIKPETVANAVRLTRTLMDKHGIPASRVLRHHDVTGKRCPQPWVQDEGQWRAFLEALEGEGNVSKEEAKKIVKEKAGLSDATIQYLAEDYRWGDELMIKLAQAMK
ncbi:MAG: N-acetylmuramoyl-L-alanine amidase family protein [Oscillospiraceae bacterium]